MPCTGSTSTFGMLRAEGAPAFAELRHALGAVAGPARALLLVELGAREADLGAVLHLVGAGLALGQLPAHDALQDVGARLEIEDVVRQIDAAGRIPVEGQDVEPHHAFSSGAAPATPPAASGASAGWARAG